MERIGPGFCVPDDARLAFSRSVDAGCLCEELEQSFD